MYKYLIYINNTINIKTDYLLNKMYEEKFFNYIDITSDGNCLYNCISYYWYGNENYNSIIRKKVYNYVLNFKSIIYDFYLIENNLCYIINQQNKKVIKYFIEDFIEKKNKWFFQGLHRNKYFSLFY